MGPGSSLRICLVGKYPPIQGGVSAQTYWTARALAGSGHQVHVVTNAGEVEPDYRIELAAEDAAWYEPDFGAASGSVRVHRPAAYSPATMRHIPETNPLVSRLAGLATAVIRAYRCDVVIGWYFEPYAVAAWLAATQTGAPLVVTHAGSDLERLMRVPELAGTYKCVLRGADAVLTSGDLMARFVGMGVDSRRLRVLPSSPPAPKLFDPGAAPLELSQLAGRYPGQIGRDFDPADPTIGILGKVAPAKGTFDLIETLGELAREGVRFNLLALIGATEGERLAGALSEAGLAQRTGILPFAPHWRVPAFIRACTIVCFLERGFSVQIHGSSVPGEVLSCGTCLVVSREMASKVLELDTALRGGVVVVEDPTDHHELAGALRPLLLDRGEAAAIGWRGHSARPLGPNPEASVATWVRLLTGIARREQLPDGVIVAPGALQLLSPVVAELTREHWPELLAELEEDTGRDPFRAAVELCTKALDRIAQHPIQRADRLQEIFRYQRARLTAGWDGAAEAPEPRGPFAQLRHTELTRERVQGLVPLPSPENTVHRFEFDLRPIFSPGDAAPLAHTDLDALLAAPSTVIFHRAPNLSHSEARINGSTQKLLDACDGSRSTLAVAAALCGLRGTDPSAAAEQMLESMLPALAHLHRLGMLVFAPAERFPL